MHDAVGNGHAEVVHLLLRHGKHIVILYNAGANLDLVNENGQTAEEFAIATLDNLKKEVPLNRLISRLKMKRK